MQKLTTFLMFVGKQYGKAEEAMKYYISIFGKGEIKEMHKNDKDGTVMHAVFTIGDQEFMAADSGADHKFTFTPAVSIAVQCQSEAEIDELYKKLSDGGKVLMALDNYGFSKKFGWVDDKYGVSWQINLF